MSISWLQQFQRCWGAARDQIPEGFRVELKFDRCAARQISSVNGRHIANDSIALFTPIRISGKCCTDAYGSQRLRASAAAVEVLPAQAGSPGVHQSGNARMGLDATGQPSQRADWNPPCIRTKWTRLERQPRQAEHRYMSRARQRRRVFEYRPSECRPHSADLQQLPAACRHCAAAAYAPARDLNGCRE